MLARNYPWSRLNSPELQALKSGDEQAFQSLVARLHGPMLRLAMGYVRDRDIAEDVVQESWLTVLKNLDPFEGRSTLKTWILGIALNIARARQRKERRVLAFSSLFRREGSGPTVEPSRFDASGNWKEIPDSWNNVPESRLLSRETMDRVRAAVDALPPNQREVLVLRDVAGLDAEAVCTMLKITAENQRVRRPCLRAQNAGGVPALICRDVVELMTDYLEGALTPAERARFEDRLTGCDGCTAYLEQLRATMRITGRIAADEPMPEDLQAELARAFKDWRSGL